MKDMIAQEFASHRQASALTEEQLSSAIAEAAQLCVDALRNGNKVMLCGNGGSASDAQHIAAELTGRYISDRCPLPGLALTTDTSALTAIANDYGYDEVFARQVRAHGRRGDVLIAISTSGNSPSILNAVAAGQENGCSTIGWSGRDGGALASTADLSLVVPSNETARIQEMHIFIGHVICQAIEDLYVTDN